MLPAIAADDVGPENVPCRGSDCDVEPSEEDDDDDNESNTDLRPHPVPTDEKADDETMSEVGLVIGICVVIILLGGIGIWCYHKK